MQPEQAQVWHQWHQWHQHPDWGEQLRKRQQRKAAVEWMDQPWANFRKLGFQVFWIEAFHLPLGTKAQALSQRRHKRSAVRITDVGPMYTT